MSYELQVEQFVEDQRRLATGQRLEMLNRNLVAEKRLLSVVLLPLLRGFDGLILEHEVISQTGVRIYIDVFYQPLKLAIESEGFAVHADKITRERFDFEKARIRTFTAKGYRHVPFSWDELEKKSDACRRSFAEIVGSYSGLPKQEQLAIGVYERELLRCMLRMNRPLAIEDAMHCLQLGRDVCRRELRKLLNNNFIRPSGSSQHRHHGYILEEKAYDYLL
ncbi:MAG: hypothetical protein P0Y55_14015 [Candidatus Cohnella colombiensis]|uniref:DNA-binding response regulator n=1 Tax=Candidatus Cohnella colombiensis TaxID=3121368 RepID=A0AA95EUI9_9BACL|nr:MAG: hypothetical protein P0Y55_14015 [Cohnella sp.]